MRGDSGGIAKRDRGALALGPVALAAILGAGSCTPTASPGDLDTLRYAGRVKGTPPLSLLPPVADASGNVYVLWGSINVPETQAFVGFAAGGWNASCTITKGDQFGAHGWAGFASTREWYWSGDALVSVSGEDGKCHAVLDNDPSTGADLHFLGVLPAVRNRAERTTLVALVESPSDDLPFMAQVDLDAEFLTNVRPFEPTDAEDVAVVGVGGDRERDVGVLLVQYRQAGAAHLEVRTYDGDANLLSVTPISGGPFAPYAAAGYLQIDPSGLVAGLVASADPKQAPALLVADGRGGRIAPVDGMQPVGAHLWDGQLWLVGVSGNAPVVAPIGAGGIGGVSTWSASLAAAGALGETTSIRDDRSLPSRMTAWSGVQTAMGQFPFLSAHALTKYAAGKSLWLFSGPTVTGSAIPVTAFAMAPVGVSYP